MNCPVCEQANTQRKNHAIGDTYEVTCHQCGIYKITRNAEVNLKLIDSMLRWKVSAWINAFAQPVIKSHDVDTDLNSTPPSLMQRADRMLRWIKNEFPPGRSFSINELGEWQIHQNKMSDPLVILGGNLISSRLVPIGWNQTIDEMIFMVTEVLCNEMGLLVSTNNHEYQVSPKGLLYLEGQREAISSIGFCAMWFNDEVQPLWAEVIEPSIRASGYEPLRIDTKQHNGKIDDEIMASIRTARFVVADFTGNRGGAYCEAGFAHGLGLPVVFMCRDGDDLHFDIRQYNCIFWKLENLDDARARLKNRILATLGQGPFNVH